MYILVFIPPEPASGSGSEPVTCRRPFRFPGLIYGANEPLAGDNIKLRCFPGLALNGSAVSTCQEDGTWSPDIPTCDPGILDVLPFY